MNPLTIADVLVQFADPAVAHEAMVRLRWPNGVSCPHCGSSRVGAIATRRTWQCKTCPKQFSIRIGTVMENSLLGLDKWLAVWWAVTNLPRPPSSYQLARFLGITQKSAWYMLQRARHLAGPV